MNYDEYRLSLREIIDEVLIYIFGNGIISYFFYRSWVVFVVLLPGFAIFQKYYKKKLIEKRKKQLIAEFSDALICIQVNLKSGYSVENAFVEAKNDMANFNGENSLMAIELQRIEKGLNINITLEELIEDLANRSKNKDIKMFSDMIKSAKRNGGNITEVLTNTADRILSGICIDQEIDTILSEKKLELRIMEAVPFLLIGYLQVTSVGYFDVLYEGINGRIFMTACLGLYCIALLIGARILRFEK